MKNYILALCLTITSLMQTVQNINLEQPNNDIPAAGIIAGVGYAGLQRLITKNPSLTFYGVNPKTQFARNAFNKSLDGFIVGLMADYTHRSYKQYQSLKNSNQNINIDKSEHLKGIGMLSGLSYAAYNTLRSQAKYPRFAGYVLHSTALGYVAGSLAEFLYKSQK